MLRIESYFGFERVAVVSEVIHRLWQVRHEDLEALGKGGSIVLIFFQHLARCFHYFRCSLFVARFTRPERGHLHVRTPFVVMIG